MYIKEENDSLIIVEVYVDDIIFGSDKDKLSNKFVESMQKEFEMSMFGELNFFLGLQISQYEEVQYAVLQTSRNSNDNRL